MSYDCIGVLHEKPRSHLHVGGFYLTCRWICTPVVDGFTVNPGFNLFKIESSVLFFHRLRCEVKTSIAKKTCILGVVQNKILSSSCKYTSHHTSYISVNFQCLTRKI